MELLITVLIVLAIAYAVIWLIRQIPGVPQPILAIAIIIVVLLAIAKLWPLI